MPECIAFTLDRNDLSNNLAGIQIGKLVGRCQQGTDVARSEASIHTSNGTTLSSEPIKAVHSDRYTTALSDE